MLTPIPHKNRLVKYDKDILRMDFQYQFMLWNDVLDDMTFARKLIRVYRDSKVLGIVNNKEIIDFTQRHSYLKKIQ